NACEWREQAKIHVHRLERARPGIDGFDMSAGDMAEQRAMRGGRWRCRNALAQPLGGREAPGEQPDRSRLHIALAAGDLAGKAQPRRRLEPQRRVEQLGRIEERIAMHAAEPRELGLLEARDGAEDAHLLAML